MRAVDVRRGLAQRHVLTPRAHGRTAGTVAAQLSVRDLRDGVAPLDHAPGELAEALLERADVRGRESPRDRLTRTLEEAVGDLGAGRAVAERRERVDDALGRVLAVDDVGGLGAVQAI